MSSDNTVKIQKKRGRKPKNKINNDEEPQKQYKKRGRKPKKKIDEEEDKIQLRKKRGRKPKPKDPIEILNKIPKKKRRNT